MVAPDLAFEVARLPLHEEVARVVRERRITGRVRVEVATSETDEAVAAVRTKRRVDIERVPVDREVSEVPATRQEDDTLVISVVEERLVLVRKLFVIEEVRLRLHVEEEPVSLSTTIRRQHAAVARLPPGDGVPSDIQQPKKANSP